MLDYTLLKDLDGKYFTLPDFIEANKPAEEKAENEASEKEETSDSGEETKDAGGEKADEEKKAAPQTVLFYVTDEIQQSQYINLFKEQGKDAVILKHNIDSAFITHVERQKENVKFQRIDADVTDDFKETVSADELKEETDTLTETFRKALNNDKLDVKVKS